MTLLTRNGDSYVSLGDRAKLINRADNAVVVSIHLNDGPRPDASGIETYFAAQQATGIPLIASWLPFLQKVANPRPNWKVRVWLNLFSNNWSRAPRQLIVAQRRSNFMCWPMCGIRPCWWKEVF